MSPGSGAHTIVVYPQKSGKFRLEANSISGASAASNQAQSSMAGDTSRGTFTVQAGGFIELGSAYGDSVVFPFEIGQTGQIHARATWQGLPASLALIINGPDRPGQPNPVAYYARSDAGSPLVVQYDVSPG